MECNLLFWTVFNRWMLRWISTGLVFVVMATAVLEAQPRFRPPPNRIDPARLNEAEGERLLERFRASGIPEPFSFHFRLEHMPRRAPTVTYEGRLWAHWWGGVHETRVHLFEGSSAGRTGLLLRNGPEPEAWIRRAGEGAETETIDRSRMMEPLTAEIAFSPFDLLMPFVHWEDWVYEGSRRMRGRPAHYFLLYPPEDDARYADISGVRILVDADFNALLQAEVLDTEGARLKTVRADSFRRVGDQWIVRRIDITDERTRDRSRFEVVAAAMGAELSEDVFTPDNLEHVPELPRPSAFSQL